MKKVLIFSTVYYPYVGGAEVAIKEITDRVGSGFEFDLVTARCSRTLPTTEQVGKVMVHRVGFGFPTMDKLLLPFGGAYVAWKLNSQKNYACFWGMMVTFGTGAAYIVNLIRSITFKKQIPIVLTLQEGDSEEHLTYRWGGLIALSWKLALRKATVLTGISTFLLDRAKKNGYEGVSHLVPNGVNLSLFSKRVPIRTQEEYKLRLRKGPSDLFLVTTSRLTHKNAVDDIVRSLVYLPKSVSLIIIGKGEEGPKLQKLARDLDVADRVKFLGYIEYENIPKYLSVCDIFIRPSRSEGFGNSFIEAMAAGVPVIATPVGGIPDFMDDKETGLFCSPDNPQSIAQAVMTLVRDHTLTEKVVLQARKRVTERYGWDRIAKEMKAVLLSVIS